MAADRIGRRFRQRHLGRGRHRHHGRACVLDRFLAINFGAILNYTVTSFSGGISGYSYVCVGGIIKGYAAIPGSGPYPGMTNCQRYPAP